jgi:hypothetical protein
MYQAFSKKGTLFKGEHYLRKYGMHREEMSKYIFEMVYGSQRGIVDVNSLAIGQKQQISYLTANIFESGPMPTP